MIYSASTRVDFARELLATTLRADTFTTFLTCDRPPSQYVKREGQKLLVASSGGHPEPPTWRAAGIGASAEFNTLVVGAINYDWFLAVDDQEQTGRRNEQSAGLISE
ncbi:MAG: hypothetical protein LQ345_002380 [Seirophora villosa]|nr:MAG: hypothetical protein LQ345_002380 [Seirophora villosa]